MPRFARSPSPSITSPSRTLPPVKGGNVSPAITITGMDPAARSIAIMVFNPFIKTCCSFTPWIIWNLPPVSRIPEGFPPGGAVFHPLPAIQGMNDYGETGYHGPEPAGGELQRYQFRVYILTAALDLREGATKNQLIAAMRGHVIQYGETVAIARG